MKVAATGILGAAARGSLLFRRGWAFLYFPLDGVGPAFDFSFAGDPERGPLQEREGLFAEVDCVDFEGVVVVEGQEVAGVFSEVSEALVGSVPEDAGGEVGGDPADAA